MFVSNHLLTDAKAACFPGLSTLISLYFALNMEPMSCSVLIARTLMTGATIPAIMNTVMKTFHQRVFRMARLIAVSSTSFFRLSSVMSIGDSTDAFRATSSP